MVKVTLCVCTCKRPLGLKRLLEAVGELNFSAQLSVIVVENDAAREGWAVCQHVAASYRWPLTCVIEEQRGISFARNRAVAAALDEDPDFIAMLDDDERPCPEWLSQLLRVQSATGADVVGGPVFPEFSVPPPPWVVQGRFFGTAQHPDGAPIALYSTNNILARSDCFRTLSPDPFDLSFALSLGHDTIFLRRLAGRGYDMRWAANAIVYEIIPEGRIDLAWLTRRHFSTGNANVRVQRLFHPGPIAETIRVIKTMCLLIGGLIFYLLSWPHQLSRIRAILMLYKAFGKITGHLGGHHFQYATLDGE